LQAAWNVTNAIQGMFIVGLPIAVKLIVARPLRAGSRQCPTFNNKVSVLKVGGWWTVAAIIGVAYLCYWTGVLLIDCLYQNGTKALLSYYKAVA
uniref:Aa_trans domain-containing protein n=1 Tax=Gongylonema pulchrum TaxID=637853 RepID=A0A183D9P3_9BILA